MDAVSWVDHATNLPDLLIACHDAAGPLIDEYSKLHDLKDDDHNGDDQEGEVVRLSWDTEPEDVDEIVT